MRVSSRIDALTESHDREHRNLRVITVRLTPDLHARLKDAAWLKHTSLNQLCVAALIEAADELEAKPAEDRRKKVVNCAECGREISAVDAVRVEGRPFCPRCMGIRSVAEIEEPAPC